MARLKGDYEMKIEVKHVFDYVQGYHEDCCKVLDDIQSASNLSGVMVRKLTDEIRELRRQGDLSRSAMMTLNDTLALADGVRIALDTSLRECSWLQTRLAGAVGRMGTVLKEENEDD